MNTSPKTVNEIREAFLAFFESKGCHREKSSSLVPLNDPTLLFNSAGMVQFKDVFTGNEKRPYTRATTAQKCLRAGGKHNDLENVGFTGRHHTFFEMMGNFSFGDYFKKEAIAWAWELVTEVYKLPKDKLHITVFRDDDEAYKIWNETIGIPKERLYRFDEKDNFWSAGDVGPCGPCTEIYIDRGPDFNTGNPELDRMGGDGDRFLEFYNLVFMQYNRDASGTMSPLPKPSVDTGLGLERLASILQNAPTNYETDLFQSIFTAIAKLSGIPYKPGMEEKSIATRVIADHLRATSFLIADGVLPSNEGRGYVLRRILRRAIRYGQKLGLQEPFMEKLVPSLVQAMGNQYPELKEKEKFIREAVLAEEKKFIATLGRGIQILNEELAKLKNGQALPGKVAFLLYDSFGFPLDLTTVVCREHKVAVDEKGFETAMEAQRQQSRSDQEGETTASGAGVDYASFLKKWGKTQFTGYQSFAGEGKVLGILQAGQEIAQASHGFVDLIFDRSVFYAESGGQVGDSGMLTDSSGKPIAKILDVKKQAGDLCLHKAEIFSAISVGQVLQQEVNKTERLKTMANHSATHLLHWALREVLGVHVKQAGSLVTSELLRFDFTHFKALSDEERLIISQMINEKIANHDHLVTKVMSKDEAISLGAMALFGEKYDDQVRVVSIGDGFSTELCGGTHVESSSQIGGFVIASESGVAAGVRRIVAYTSITALSYLSEKALALDSLRDSLKAQTASDVLDKVAKLQAKEKELEKKLQAMQAESAGSIAKDLIGSAKTIGDALVIQHLFPEGGMDLMRSLGDRIKDQATKPYVLFLGAVDKAAGKAFVQVTVSQELTNAYNAGKIIQAIAPMIEGKGGGKPEQAQAGGPGITGLQKALDTGVSLLGK